jgi:hypothetical protein
MGLDHVKCPRAEPTAGGRHEGEAPSCSSHGITRLSTEPALAGWSGGSPRDSLVPHEQKESDMSTTHALPANTNVRHATLTERASGVNVHTTETGVV